MIMNDYPRIVSPRAGTEPALQAPPTSDLCVLANPFAQLIARASSDVLETWLALLALDGPGSGAPERLLALNQNARTHTPHFHATPASLPHLASSIPDSCTIARHVGLAPSNQPDLTISNSLIEMNIIFWHGL
jgi:hypothetical protein